MKTFKIILFAALLIYHVASIIIISIGKNDLNFLFDLFKKMDLLQYGAIFGLIVFLVIIGLFQFQEKSIQKLNLKHENELNQLKAKLYDKKESEGVNNKVEPVQQKPTELKNDQSDSTETDHPTDQA